MARTIAVANQKGGVGKTTTAVNLGAALAELGQRVLLLDLDSQAHLTINMGSTNPDDLPRTIYHLLVDPRVTINDVVRQNDSMGVHYIPANIELAGADMQLMNEIGREGILKEKLEPARRRYDFIIIDCPPALTLLTVNAFVASDEIIIPLQCEYFGMKGMEKLLQTMDRVRAKLNPKLKVAGILPTIYKARTKHSQEVLELVQMHFGELVYPFVVKDSIRFAESPIKGYSILQYVEASEGAEAYRSLARAVLESQPHQQPRERVAVPSQEVAASLEREAAARAGIASG